MSFAVIPIFMTRLVAESGGNIPRNAGPRNDAKFLPNKSSAFVRENNVPLD